MKKKSCGRLICAAPEACADLLYAGGFNAPDPIVWFQTPEFQAIVVSILEYERACVQAKKNVRVLPLEEFFRKEDKWKNDDLLIQRISEKYGINEWSVPGDFPVSTADFRCGFTFPFRKKVSGGQDGYSVFPQKISS